MESRIFGYVRVSSKDQNEDRQLVSMKKLGIDGNGWKRVIYRLLNYMCGGGVI